MTDKPNFTSVTFDLGPWMRRRERGGWEETDGPHFHEWADRNDPVNQVGVIWADEKRTDPHRVRDTDGCEATVLGLSPTIGEASSSYDNNPETPHE